MSLLAQQRWTFRGVQVFPFAACLLANVPCKGGCTTVALVGYDDAHPVRISVAKVREAWS